MEVRIKPIKDSYNSDCDEDVIFGGRYASDIIIMRMSHSDRELLLDKEELLNAVMVLTNK